MLNTYLDYKYEFQSYLKISGKFFCNSNKDSTKVSSENTFPSHKFPSFHRSLKFGSKLKYLNIFSLYHLIKVL